MVHRMIDTLGGEAVLRRLVNDFYDIIETAPEGENIRKLHLRGHGLAHVREEQFNFLSGFLGGRAYYREIHGHMDLRLLHAHIPITPSDADNWLICMDRALSQNGLQGPEVDRLRNSFRRICQSLVNETPKTGH